MSTEGIANPPGIATEISPTAEPCDFKDNGTNGGEGPDAATPTAALYDAATARGLAFNATWESKFNDFFVSRVGNDINQNTTPFDSWGYAVNYTTANVGGCQFQLAPGSEVLWAYNYFNLKHLLNLSGPATANVGTPFTVHVVDGQTGVPISGAAIGEVVAGVTTPIPASPMTDANGNATIKLTAASAVTLKATQAESVRSNGLAVCVHNGADGTCGTTVASGGSGPIPIDVQTPAHVVPSALAKITGVKNGRVYSRRSAPRVLEGVVEVPAGGTLREVRIRLERRYHGRCFDFSGSRVRFVRARKCGTASFFSVGRSESFSYLLPARLPAGRYVYDIQAVDNSGRSTKLVNGVSHVVFRVK